VSDVFADHCIDPDVSKFGLKRYLVATGFFAVILASMGKSGTVLGRVWGVFGLWIRARLRDL